jgi:hypothetical protein
LLTARLRTSDLSKHITLVWPHSLRLAKHQRGSRSPAPMASDSWIAASMRQSDAEIETIAARPKRARRRQPRRCLSVAQAKQQPASGDEQVAVRFGSALLVATSRARPRSTPGEITASASPRTRTELAPQVTKQQCPDAGRLRCLGLAAARSTASATPLHPPGSSAAAATEYRDWVRPDERRQRRSVTRSNHRERATRSARDCSRTVGVRR